MKLSMKRMLCLVLVLCLMGQWLPVPAQATFGGGINDTSIHIIEEETVINPLYADVVTEEELVRPSRSQVYSPDDVAKSDYVDTMEEAIAVLREAMTQRQSETTVYYKAEAYNNSYFSTIFYGAMEHTGEPKEGDSLFWGWAGAKYSGGYSISNGVYYISLVFTVTYYTTAEQESELDAAVDAVLAELDVYDGSDYEKVKAVYDYICTNVTYDYDNLEDETYKLKYTPYAALLDGTAVCQGYALLLYRFALELGLDVRVIVGSSNGNGVQDHGWNIVRLDGKYYNADSTWDAGYSRYIWFLQCEADFTRDYTRHIRSADYDTAEFHAAYPMDTENYDPNAGPAGPAKVAGGTCGKNLTWVLTDDGVLTISGTGTMKNYTYKSEMPWYSYLGQITSVVIEEGVTSIGDYAFYGMDIVSIEIPESVTAIGSYAFKNAASLDNVVLPSGLTKLGESAFYACASLSAIEIPASLWTIQPYTFKNCTALESVTFHEGNLMKISDGAFYNTALTSVALPDCLTILDVYVFKNCARLAEVKLSSGLTQIREASLYGTAISAIEIPEGVASVGPYAFKNCVNLVSIDLPESLTSVDEAAFYACTALSSLDLPDTVTKIGDYAFRKCAALAEVSFGSGLVNIGESSFYGCEGLIGLEIPEAVTTIQGYAFKGCTGLKVVNLPDSLVTLGDSAFHTCTGLSEITIPVNVTQVGAYCFSGSTGIKTIEFLGNAPTIGTGAFNKITAAAFYPGGNATWTSDVMQNYGGTITWNAN